MNELLPNSIIPQCEIDYPEGRSLFHLPKELLVDFSDFSPHVVQAFSERTSLLLNRDNKRPAWLLLRRNPQLSEEAYRLLITAANIQIEASDDHGVIFALTTVFLLMDNRKTLPLCRVEDSPAMKHRGLSLDCAREFFSAETILKVIENISLVKMNVLHWHLSDDQAWRIQSSNFPALNIISPEFYTKEDIHSIVQYAKNRGVEIIPEIDMPGHVKSILAAYPELSCKGEAVDLATTAGIFRDVFCASSPLVYKFLDTLFAEICPLFPNEYFHFGNDEVPTIEWEECPQCLAEMRKRKLPHARMLQAVFAKKARELLQKHGKKCIAWNDLLLSQAPHDCKIQYWTINHAKSMNEYALAGKPYIYSNMFRYYFDYPYSMSPLKKVYEHEAHIGWRKCSEDPGFEGMEACIWAEHIRGSEQLEKLLFPRMLAVAERAWSKKRASYQNFLARVKKHQEQTSYTAVQYMNKEHWDPKGKVRRREAIQYFRNMNTSVTPEQREESWRNAAPGIAFQWSFYRDFYKAWDIFHILYAMRK